MEQDKLWAEGALIEGSAESDGKGAGEVIIDLIVEGFGNARDNHYYSANVLREAAEDFAGAKQYVDHLDPEAQRKLNGMPRSVRDLAGRITEAWVTQNDDGRTVIRGKAKIAQPWLWSLIESDPGLIGVSINAWGKSKPGTVEGRQARIVEGISKVGSVDWVTEAGAGGKVVSLVEAQLNEEDGMDKAATAEPAEEREEEQAAPTVESLIENHPDVVEELLALQEDDAEAEEPEPEYEEDEDDSEDEEQTVEAIEAVVEERALELAQEQLEEAVKAAIKVVQARFGEQLAEQEAEFTRQIAQIEQRHLAATLIEQAGFKAPTEKALKEEFHDAYFEGTADEEGQEVSSAEDELRDAVKRAVERKRQEIASYTEARVTGQGESETLSEGEVARPRPKKAPADQQLDAILGIASENSDS